MVIDWTQIILALITGFFGGGLAIILKARADADKIESLEKEIKVLNTTVDNLRKELAEYVTKLAKQNEVSAAKINQLKKQIAELKLDLAAALRERKL